MVFSSQLQLCISQKPASMSRCPSILWDDDSYGVSRRYFKRNSSRVVLTVPNRIFYAACIWEIVAYELFEYWLRRHQRQAASPTWSRVRSEWHGEMNTKDENEESDRSPLMGASDYVWINVGQVLNLLLLTWPRDGQIITQTKLIPNEKYSRCSDKIFFFFW